MLNKTEASKIPQKYKEEMSNRLKSLASNI